MAFVNKCTAVVKEAYMVAAVLKKGMVKQAAGECKIC